MAKNTSCLTPAQVTTCQYYIEETTGNCVKGCGKSNEHPVLKNGVLYCAPGEAEDYVYMDSAIYEMPDGTKHVIFALSEDIATSKPVHVNIVKEPPSPALSSDGTLVATNSQAVPLKSNFVAMHDLDTTNNQYLFNATNASNVVTSSGLGLTNTVYGVSVNQSHP